jgi:peptidylprolyl isomerase
MAHRSDSGVNRWIDAGLRDRAAKVRTMAAFAAGQRGASEQASLLLRLSMTEGDRAARSAMLDAFGRLASAQALDSLSVAGARDRGVRRAEVLTAMMRAAIRGQRAPSVMWYAFESLADRDAEVRWRALYVLGRSAPHPLLETEVASRRDVLLRLCGDRSADVRINLATMLARIDVPEAREILRRLSDLEFARRDRDWRVLVQTVRSAAAHLRSDEAMGGILAKGLADRNDHVVIAAAMALPSDSPTTRGMGLRDSIRALLWGLIPAGEGRASLVTGESMVALARFSPADIEGIEELVGRATLEERLRAKSFEAFSMSPTSTGWRVISAAWQDPSPSVAMAAWDHARRFLRHPGLGAIVPDRMTRSELSTFVVDQAELALDRRDMGISTVVSSLLGDSSVMALIDSGSHRARTVKVVAAALSRMRAPDDVEAMQAAIQTLGSLGGSDALRAVEAMLASDDASVVEVAVGVLRSSGRTDFLVPPRTAPPPPTSDDWALLRSLGSKPTATFRTDRGSVLVQLLPEEAPFTVLSFVRLARAGFYNGLTFHRVVPNFVVQGGDPRGDGWGGPGYSIRTEVTPRSYERGAVGMASAGRDTEGSQFFFTHLPTPHLDARYTIFALVREGMDVVDRWHVGDVIREVRVASSGQRGVRSR